MIITAKIENLTHWATTAVAGDYAARYEQMSCEETAAGYWVVTQDANGSVIWEGEATDGQAAYDHAERANTGSRCGWGDSEIDAAQRILARSDLTLVADDRGLVVAVSADPGADA